MTGLGVKAEQPTWSGFLSGCLLILLVVFTIAGAFRWWMGRQQAVAVEVRETGLDPYWMAILAQDYQRASRDFTTATWQQRHGARELEANYRAAVGEYGKLQKFEIVSVNEGHEPGQVGRQVWVEAALQFERGPLVVSYQLLKLDANSGWRVDQSSTQGQGTLRGPW